MASWARTADHGRPVRVRPCEVDWADHLLGRTVPGDGSDLRLDGRSTLLDCTCGCGNPFYARILVDSGSVYWHDFANPYRDWTYADLPAFRFDESGYVDELRRFVSVL